MRVIIEDDYLANLYHNGKSSGKPRFNIDIELGFIKRITQMEQAQSTNDLRVLKSLHFEKLSGDLSGKYSIRVNKAFRIVFRIEKDGNNTRVEIICVEELNNHYS
ncbi:type II toxin-antitoxin system RelE/ParE family toxin [Mucilaginibacter jinjuensis]|uniref:Type II toxin-antitoxin system RelE/ParE family toxin n=1 Tax=Mucilaginibacter jinjuensis TaxID=1176721 RepID=A0ABY7T8S9_9SPHI|nr:type II toxin-antitoxin system RelE/ParE family toxin [Mucilaginibacter jinjuensis]WCT12664.1 type II toxin-antitoxin system RelE/ParE family toxin [Mucilaginibacter jinjuensis]